MEEIKVPKYMLVKIQDALRLAANAFESRKRETAMDRSIEMAERMTNWCLNGRVSDPPSYFPRLDEKH